MAVWQASKASAHPPVSFSLLLFPLSPLFICPRHFDTDTERVLKQWTLDSCPCSPTTELGSQSQPAEVCEDCFRLRQIRVPRSRPPTWCSRSCLFSSPIDPPALRWFPVARSSFETSRSALKIGSLLSFTDFKRRWKELVRLGEARRNLQSCKVLPLFCYLRGKFFEQFCFFGSTVSRFQSWNFSHLAEED